MPSVVAGPKMWFMGKPERASDAMLNAGSRLRVLRAVLGMSQQDMARSLQVEPQTWNNWERGRNLVDPLVMARASLRYDFTLDWIYIGSLARMPRDLATAIEARRPDLILGAEAGAEPAADWDAVQPPGPAQRVA